MAGRALVLALASSLLLAGPAAAAVQVRSDEAGLVINVGGPNGVTSDLRVAAERNSAGQRTAMVVFDESLSGDFVLPPGGLPCQEGVGFSTGRPFVRCAAPPLAFVVFSGRQGGGRDELVLENGAGDCLCDGKDGADRIIGADGADLIQGGDGNDVLRGGSEADVIEGGDGADEIGGGPEADVLRGGPGDDRFVTGTGSDGADAIDGGEAIDTVDYGPRSSSVRASIDGVANDGTLLRNGSEGDNIGTTVERLTGGRGRDQLIGSSGVNLLLGGAGNDILRGGDGNDTLDGGLGSDLLQGEAGRDRLRARDAVDDQVDTALSCGPGTEDVLEADVRDDDTRALPADCESVSQGMVREHPNVTIRSATRAGLRHLSVRLRCPRATRNGCAGRLAVGAARTRRRFGPSARYRIRRGGSQVVRVQARRPARTRRGARIRVRSREKGRLGPRTTLKTLVVR